MCGYRLFGTRFYQMQDFSDDGEAGGGRIILDQLKLSQIWNTAVFVVRYHQGPNLGKRHFEIIKTSTRDAIAAFPKALNYGRFFQDTELLSILNGAENDKQKYLKTMRERASRGRKPNQQEQKDDSEKEPDED